MIVFKKIRYKNILSVGNQFIELNLNNHNTTLIVGKNSSGKSTFIEALSFVLYGKPYRKINKPQLVNSITKKDLVVEVEFTSGSDQYKIIRGLKPNIFELYKNDALINQDAASRDYQEMLEKQILKINHKSFCQVVVLGTASFVPFMQLSSQARREIIEDLLDLQIFSTMNVLLKDKISQNNDEIYEVQSDKKVTETEVKMNTEHFDNIQKNNEKFISDKESQIESTLKLIDSLQIINTDVIKESQTIAEQLSNKAEVKDKHQKCYAFESSLITQKQPLHESIKFYEENDQCAVCQQTIQPDFKAEAIIKNNHKIQEVDTKLAKLSKEKIKLENKLKEFSELSKKINDLNLEISKNNTKIVGYNENISNWRKEIDDNKNNNNFIDKAKIEELKNKLLTLDEEYAKLIDIKDVFVSVGSILKDGGIKSVIIKQYIPIINKLINKYLAAMDFFVKFELDEQFDETIKSRGRDDFTYASFSEGEKMRIDLAVLFTWRAIAKMRNSVNTNLLILDEVFDSSLDINGTEEFLKIINSMATDNNTFVVSHRSDQAFDKFDHVLQFEKYKNFTRLAS